MRNLTAIVTLLGVGLIAGLQSTAAIAANNHTYVDAISGTDTANTTCAVDNPCQTLNHALLETNSGGSVLILRGAIFGPIIITQPISIIGPGDSSAQIFANSAANAGCIGASPGSCGANRGFAVDIRAPANATVKISHVAMAASSNGRGALSLLSAGKLHLVHNVYRGSSTYAIPIVQLSPSIGGATNMQIYMASSDIAFNHNSGAIEMAPRGSTTMLLHVNHVEVHNANYGILADGSGTTGGVKVSLADSEFFSFSGNAVEAKAAGASFASVAATRANILNAGGSAIKAGGAGAVVVLNQNTIVGNNVGVEVAAGGEVDTMGNNTIIGNNTDVSGSMTSQALQ